MKLIVAGTRSITSIRTVADAFEESPFEWDEVEALIHGGAEGVDSSADVIGSVVPHVSVDEMPYTDFIEEAPSPKVAPLIRNERMAERGDALLAVWDGESAGTENMITNARDNGLRTYVFRTDDVTTLSDF